jgi:hypothetical protein
MANVRSDQGGRPASKIRPTVGAAHDLSRARHAARAQLVPLRAAGLAWRSGTASVAASSTSRQRPVTSCRARTASLSEPLLGLR